MSNTATATHKLSQDGTIKYIGSEDECYFKLQRSQGMSSDWAMKHEGWKIEPVTAYYRDELAKIETTSEYAPTMRITSATGNTKYININKESAAELIQWLTINFINK